MQGHYKGKQIVKVVQVYRKKYVISTKWVQQDKVKGITVHVNFHSSKVVITRLNKDHKSSLNIKSSLVK